MKQSFIFSSEAWNYNNTRLTNQIFKLLPMYEHNENWESQLEGIIFELKGYNDIFIDNPGFMTLVAKLNALKYADNQMIFRKLVFEALGLLKEITI